MGKKKTVLIVDDSSTNQILLEVLLEEDGYTTYSTSSAKETFKFLQSKKPDLILLDLLMPQVNGFDILNQVKANPETAKIPVVIVSAVGSDENIQTCLKLGASDFFCKPIDIPTFISKINQYLCPG